ncbi:MAG: response regulator transcription factor [Polyangiaceae bacterium]
MQEEISTSNGSLDGKRILVVEDDPSISLGLRMNLEAEGYSVQVADDGEAGLELARTRDVDLIVLDVMLPKLNGFEVLKLLRAEDQITPVIVLSARDTELDVVMGLELGAEDYVTKPFSLAELLARVKAVLRRNAVARRAHAAEPPAAAVSDAAPGDLVQIGELSIDARTRQVNKAGTLVALTATEFDVLWCLVQGGGRVLTREEIQSAVWGPKHHGTRRTIDNFMMQLRTKLERDPSEPDYLLTVRGVGYRLKF